MANNTGSLPKLPRGMGSYSYKDKDHTVIQYRKVIGEGENRKRHTVNGKTVQVCNRKMAAAEQEYKEQCRINAARNPHNASLILKEAVYQWMIQFKQSQMKSKSYDTIEGIYERYLKPAEFSNKQTEQVIDADIQQWLTDINQRLSDSTTKKCHSLLKMFFEYYYAKRPYDSPMITVVMPKKENQLKFDEEGMPIPPNKENKILDDEEIERFEREASRQYNPGVDGYIHGLVLVFMMWCFIRDGEALALQWRDIDFENKRIYLYKDFEYVKDRSDSDKAHKWELNIAKTSSGVRYVYLCNQAIDALLEYRDRMNLSSAGDEYIFKTEYDNPISDDSLNRTLKSVLKKAGIDKHVTVHDLRHSGISFYRRHGVDPDVVSSMAGHSSRWVTDQVYYTITHEQYLKEMEKINRQKI